MLSTHRTAICGTRTNRVVGGCSQLILGSSPLAEAGAPPLSRATPASCAPARGARGGVLFMLFMQ